MSVLWSGGMVGGVCTELYLFELWVCKNETSGEPSVIASAQDHSITPGAHFNFSS